MPAEPTTPPETVLVLRTCSATMKAHGDFKWPESGPVEAPDWNPVAKCGQGLHGLLWGQGEYSLLNHDADAKWVVVEVAASSIVDLNGKVKFPRGTVVFVGECREAFAFVDARLPEHLKKSGEEPVVSTKHLGTASNSGYLGTASNSGDLGTASNSGDRGTASNSGDLGTASNSGYRGTASNSGDRGTASNSGCLGTASNSGDLGTASNSGDLGTASNSGYRGTASNSGCLGTASNSGCLGTASSSGAGIALGTGNESMVSGGDKAVLALAWWDEATERPRLTIGYVGEAGIKPNTRYRLDSAHNFEEVID